MPKSSQIPPVSDNDAIDSRQDKKLSLKSSILSNPLSKKPAKDKRDKHSQNIFEQAKLTKTHDGVGINISDILDTEYRGISLYSVAMILLVLAILGTGVSVVEQVQTYHQQYGELQKLKKQFRQLQMEHQRMLIEQQTFSATPQVTNRAVTELNMFYPNLSDRLIIHANSVTTLKPTSDATISEKKLGNDIDPDSQH